MQIFITKITTFITNNKTYLFPIIPLFFIVIFIILILITSVPTNPSTIPTNKTSINNSNRVYTSPTPTQNIETKPIAISSAYDPEYSVDPTELGAIEKEDILPDGSIKYTLASENLPRTNVVLVKDETLIFRRAVNPVTDLQPIEPFLNLYGNPDLISIGSTYYGGAYNKYIYAQLGFTLIVNDQTKMVVEQHFFEPTTPDTYLNRFGKEDQ